MFPGETIMSGAKVDDHVSEFQVLESAAGWYIGTHYTYCDEPTCTNCMGLPAGFKEPYSRETDYFPSQEAAQKALDDYRNGGLLEKERI